MANGLLIVEGISDRDFVEAFLEYENLNIELDVRVVTAPDIDTAVSHTTKQGVIRSLDAVIKQLNDGSYERVGVMIDMDFKHDSPIPIKQLNPQQLATKLSQYDFMQVIQSTNDKGIFFENADFDHPIGVWLMPDNENEGYLEHWIVNSIKNKTASYFDNAKQFIDSFDDSHFKPHTITKAEVYTWLAIQPKPCTDLSRCLSAKYDLLDKNSTSYQNFKAWLMTTFS